MPPSSRGEVGQHGCLNHVVVVYHYLLDSAIYLVGYIVMVFCDFAIIYTFDKLKYINERVKYYAKMKAGG